MVLFWLKMYYDLAMDHGNDRRCFQTVIPTVGTRPREPSRGYPAHPNYHLMGMKLWENTLKARTHSVFSYYSL